MTIEDIMTAHEASAFLGVHVQTVRRLARAGNLPCFKVGKDWRFRREALLRWADGQQYGAGGDTRCSVLIIDDEESVCTVLSRMVERFGCRARWATNGADGLEMLSTAPPDIVLLDLQMPGMTGPEVLAALRRTHPTLPVIIVTGYPESHLVQQAMDQAPVLMIAKPVNERLLARTIHSSLGEKMTGTFPG